MRDEISVVEFDGDEAVAEAVAGLEETAQTRGNLIKAGAGALAGVGLLGMLRPGTAAAREGGTKSRDVKILNYALTLEYLEAAFYAEALRVGGFTGSVRYFAEVVGSHETAHVAALQGGLGAKAGKRPKVDFQGTAGNVETVLRTPRRPQGPRPGAHQ